MAGAVSHMIGLNPSLGTQRQVMTLSAGGMTYANTSATASRQYMLPNVGYLNEQR